ncbi:microtubule-associated tumor suppressor 1 homolog isoform X2 [Nothobranchius furzeri]|nr:transcript variant X1 [Nothobranchius furzeri]KAF7227766.1 transcript variant X2 [Nothobranchius furzeri]KAF7227767.1 transcript variant X4 [Nothobranchius furzeri]KAF7227768.1 transcript variant X3 [Nothobranchius furzeri]
MDYRAARQRKCSHLSLHEWPNSHHNNKMSHKTLGDPVGSSVIVPHSSRQFALSSQSLYTSASPDTNSISSQKETEARSSPYVYMDRCFGRHSSVCSMNETFIVTPKNGIQNEHIKSETPPSFSGHSKDRGNDEVTSPDPPWKENRLNSGEASCENDYCFLPSTETMRSVGFTLEEQKLVAVSLLEESNIPSAASPLFTAESSLMSAMLPVCEKLADKVSEISGHPSLGVTFIQSDNLELLKDPVTTSSRGALPSESEGDLSTTFIWDTSTDLTNSEGEQLTSFTKPGEAFVSAVSAIRESPDDLQTSTPGQNVEMDNPKPKATSSNHRPAVRGPASAARAIEISSEMMQTTSSQVSSAPAHQAATRIAGSKKAPARSGQTDPKDPKPTPKKDASRIRVTASSVVGQQKPTVGKTWKPRLQKQHTDGQSVQLAEEPYLSNLSQSSGTRPPRSPAHTSPMGPPLSPASRIPQKIQGPPRALNKSSGHSEQDRSSGTPALTSCRPSLSTTKGTSPLTVRLEKRSQYFKPAGPVKPRTVSALTSSCGPAPSTSKGDSHPTVSLEKRNPCCKPVGPVTPRSALTSPCRPAPSSSKGASHPTVSLEKRITHCKPAGPTTPRTALTSPCRSAPSTSKGAPRPPGSLEKNSPHCKPAGPVTPRAVHKKSKTSSRQEKSQQGPTHRSGSRDGIQANDLQGERSNQNIQQLKQLLADSNRRFQAIAIVLQQSLTRTDEATRQCRELYEEQASLQEELASSVHSCVRLEKEKEELRATLQDAAQRLQEQHQKDLAELEQKTSYQAEWDKSRLACQEEADECRTLMLQQMEELKASHEAMKQKLESSHEEQLQRVKQQHDSSLQALRNAHTQELQRFEKTCKDTEFLLRRELEELTVKNNALMEKLAAHENRRKELAEHTQKDSHTLYLEQELESLKVILDLKNKHLHQQEKKLVEIKKLTDKNVTLEERLIKVQQENEDLKARMERHAALSRQLSQDQAMLQESLQKESKVNKRLSMENEELLWKLHNGDPSSPQRMSPISTAPSQFFKLQSACSFSSPPVSPR